MPSTGLVMVATALSVAGSLAVDALLVAIGTRLVPTTAGYAHFRFTDYATLTVIGVVVAGAAWPMVVRHSSAPRWLYLRLAVLVTGVLWLPDLYLLVRGEPVRAVLILMVMHLAIALVTYNVVVRVAPVPDSAGETSPPVPAISDPVAAGAPASEPDLGAGRLPGALAVAVGIEFALGIATLILVPTGRPTGLVPTQGRTIFLLHAIVGVPLAAGAVLLLGATWRGPRISRLCAWIGGVGVAMSGLGGILTVAHPLRLVGIGLMLVGPVVAGFGYLLPTFDRLSETPVDDQA
jgi:hypothetical protein